MVVRSNSKLLATCFIEYCCTFYDAARLTQRPVAIRNTIARTTHFESTSVLLKLQLIQQ